MAAHPSSTNSAKYFKINILSSQDNHGKDPLKLKQDFLSLLRKYLVTKEQEPYTYFQIPIYPLSTSFKPHITPLQKEQYKKAIETPTEGTFDLFIQIDMTYKITHMIIFYDKTLFTIGAGGLSSAVQSKTEEELKFSGIDGILNAIWDASLEVEYEEITVYHHEKPPITITCQGICMINDKEIAKCAVAEPSDANSIDSFWHIMRTKSGIVVEASLFIPKVTKRQDGTLNFEFSPCKIDLISESLKFNQSLDASASQKNSIRSQPFADQILKLLPTIKDSFFITNQKTTDIARVFPKKGTAFFVEENILLGNSSASEHTDIIIVEISEKVQGAHAPVAFFFKKQKKNNVGTYLLRAVVLISTHSIVYYVEKNKSCQEFFLIDLFDNPEKIKLPTASSSSAASSSSTASSSSGENVVVSSAALFQPAPFQPAPFQPAPYTALMRRKLNFTRP